MSSTIVKSAGTVIGTSVIALAIMFGISSLGNDPVVNTEEMDNLLAQQLKPVGQVNFVEEVAAAVVPTAAADGHGKTIYDATCQVCHAAAIAGAPKFGDAAAWKDRIAQGMDVLTEHAINGFQGKTGMMPPKGGAMNLSDDDIKAAIKYMVDAASGS